MRHRLLETLLDGWVDPAEAFATLYADAPRAVWLDCGVGATDGISVIASGTRLATAEVSSGTVTVDGTRATGTIFELLRATGETAPSGTGFRLGWVGWLGYGLNGQTLGRAIAWDSQHPDAALLFVDRAVVFDHAAQSVSLLALAEHGWSGELADWRDRMLAGLAAATADSAMTAGVAAVPAPAEVHWATTDEQYLERVAACLAAIAAGDAYQLCLTTEVRVDARPDPFATYLALRASSPTHHGAFFRVDELSLLSASPEQFLTVSPDGIVESKPIKGTRRRGVNGVEDLALVAELRGSEKEQAENLMIVDLMRNDIARVSQVGSVSVPFLLEVETYAHVHQLVSTVRGRLAEGLTGVDAAVACFPAGSMTGAPKRSAVDILETIEGRARGVYSGAFGYVGLDGRIDLAMVIRSILLDGDGATIGTGGGITALSVPEEELEEAKLKAAALIAVLTA